MITGWAVAVPFIPAKFCFSDKATFKGFPDIFREKITPGGNIYGKGFAALIANELGASNIKYGLSYKTNLIEGWLARKPDQGMR